MHRSRGRSSLTHDPTPAMSIILERIAKKMNETAQMAHAIQYSLHPDGTAVDRIRFIQNLDRIEQTMTDCAQLLRSIASMAGDVCIDRSRISPPKLQETRDILTDAPAEDVPNSGTVQWL